MADAQSDVANRYASALFDLAAETGVLDRVEQDLNSLSTLLDDSEDLQRLAMSPVFDVDAKSKGFAAVLDAGNAQAITRNFIGLLAKNRRLASLRSIIVAFRTLAAEHRGEVSAEAVSARALTSDQEAALRTQIESSVGKSVNLSTSVDPSLLGGLIVKVGSRMIDSSLRTKLNRLQQSLKEA